jgi:hypothetical protein
VAQDCKAALVFGVSKSNRFMLEYGSMNTHQHVLLKPGGVFERIADTKKRLYSDRS